MDSLSDKFAVAKMHYVLAHLKDKLISFGHHLTINLTEKLFRHNGEINGGINSVLNVHSFLLRDVKACRQL